MNVVQAQTVFDHAVSGEYKVHIQATKEETDELRKALATVDKYKQAALKAVKHKEKDADFTVYKYAVKTDLVVVIIETGACG